MDERDQYSLEKMKSVFAAAPCGVGIFAAGTREPLFLNNAYYRLVGYTPEEYRQLISNEDRKLFYPPDEHMSERVAQRYASDGCLAGVQYRVVQKDGGVCWVELNMISVTVDGGDCALCFFENITAEKENFAQMKLVAESIGSSICALGAVAVTAQRLEPRGSIVICAGLLGIIRGGIAGFLRARRCIGELPH